MARSLTREAGEIDWSLSASDIVNLIRGCTPRPGSFAKFNNMIIKVWSASVANLEDRVGEPGEVIEVIPDGVIVAAESGSVLLREVQPESRQRMKAADFVRGTGLHSGSRFA